jgi:hypothetical protein
MSTSRTTTLTLILTPALAAIALAACSGGRDLSLGGLNNQLLGNDAGGDSGGTDSGPSSGDDAGKPGALSCTESVVAECNAENELDAGTHCYADFASAQAGCGTLDTLSSCGQYDEFTSGGTDTKRMGYFYDHATGQLVAIFRYDPEAATVCVGGPSSGFVAPTCGALTYCVTDAASPSDASPDAAQPLACPTGADAVCTTNDGGWPPSCYPDWTHARAACGQTQSYTSCGQYDAINDLGVDSGYRYFYDHASGNLVAVVGFSLTGDSCIGGPTSGFIEPACSGWTSCL